MPNRMRLTGASVLLLVAALVACSNEPAGPPTDAARATIATAAAATTVDERFLSVAVDSAQVVGGTFWDPRGGVESGAGTARVAPYDFDDPRLRRLAAPLAPAYLRIGGSDADKVFVDFGATPITNPPDGYEWVMTREQWDRVHRFAEDLGYGVMFTINGGPGPRDEHGAWVTDQAAVLFEDVAAHDHAVDLWELTNEPNGMAVIHDGFTIAAAQLAADFRRLRTLLDDRLPGARLGGPSSAYWPHLAEALDPVYADFMTAAGDVLDVVTWHYYPQQSRRCPVASRRAKRETMLSAEALDEAARLAAIVEAERDDHAPQAEVWLGETGNAQCGGEPGVSDRFEGGFWWLDQLGLLARRGQRVVVRQTLSGSDYGLLDDVTLDPRPDYFNSLMWQRLMGPRVLVATPGAGAPASLRLYAHCTPEHDGRLAVLAINLAEAPAAVRLDGFDDDAYEWWPVTAPSLDAATIYVADEPARVDGDDVWAMPTVPPRSGPPWWTMPPRSYGFARLDADAAACR